MARLALKQMLTNIDYVNIIGDFENPLQGLNILNSGKVDLILLDVEMPKMTGLDLLKSIDKPPLTILITGKRDYAIEAFEQNVVDYLLKPVDEKRLVKSINRAKQMLDKLIEKSDTDFIFVREKNLLQKIEIDKINYIQALGDYLIIFTTDGKHTVHLTLKSFLEKFNGANFMRIHRSFIIALNKIERVEEGTAYIGKHPIPIGDNYRQELLKRINLI